MKIKKILIVIFTLFIFLIGIIILYSDFRVRKAKIKVKLKENLTAEVFSNVKVSDYIEEINGKLTKDIKINTEKIGKQKVRFYYVNDENIRVSYIFEIDVVDTTAPLISNRESLTLYQGYNENIMDNFFCGDNYDDNLSCNIVGNYDVNKIGEYPVTFVAEDSSGNKTTDDFRIKIISEERGGIKSSQEYTYFSDVLNTYKTKDTKIGIDVSKWEGDIDFKKIKEEGVEFAYIRIGHQKGKNGEYIIDPKFKQNIEGFKNQDIKVGVYFFSYATTKEEAQNQAIWVIKQLKDYKIDLEVVFDWENWDGYNNYNLSFYNLSQVAKAFMEYMENRGYNTMHYSSKYYLENVWFDTNRNVWLAHYTDVTDYKGKYKVWQICENGKIDGIEDMVDIDIMYD